MLGNVIDTAKLLEEKLEKAYDKSKVPERYDFERVNEFLLKVRRATWD